MNTAEIKQYFIESVKFVNKIAEDIKKNNCNEDVINYAKKYVQLENEHGAFWRVNFGGAYAYIDIDKNGLPTGKIWWNNEDIGCDELNYEETINKLENMINEDILNTDETSYFEGYESLSEYLPLRYKIFIPIN